MLTNRVLQFMLLASQLTIL
uniref:Uncharacterized protein n=1 Tax=Rhizophora mucronata TaxID=61149 RepID=A0A2P2PYV9_RHIMU